MAVELAARTAPTADADVVVLQNGEHRRPLPTTLAMADVAYDVLLERAINISPLPLWLDEWERPEIPSAPGAAWEADAVSQRLQAEELSCGNAKRRSCLAQQGAQAKMIESDDQWAPEGECGDPCHSYQPGVEDLFPQETVPVDDKGAACLRHGGGHVLGYLIHRLRHSPAKLFASDDWAGR